MTDYISRADAIEAVCRDCTIERKDKCKAEGYCYEVQNLKELPSADAESDDLIIKGAKGIKDGLYNITDGKLFKYKANGGTVRTYPIVPSADAVHIHNDGTLEVKVPNAQKVGRVFVMDTDSHIGGGLFYPESADVVSGYTEWLEKIIVDNEGANEWLCEDTPDLEWCEKNCHYSSIQAECLRHLYEVSKGGDDE